MKKRIKIDSSILSLLIICTGTLFLFKNLYPKSIFADNVFDFIGVIVLLKGTVLRMVARGHKKRNSNKGGELVIDGPYLLTRNPMYLGSFLIGCGFILILWPWWSLPIFAVLFYLRFNKQMLIEEKHLAGLFGKDYENYCRKIPRLFPKLSKLLKVRAKDVICLDDAFDTKESRGLIAWPVLGFVFELFQQALLRGRVEFYSTYVLFISAAVFFSACFVLVYQAKN